MAAMKLQLIDIGSAPRNEKRALVLDENYIATSRVECAAFRAQILRCYPLPSDGSICGLNICLNPHEFGSCREVGISYDPKDASACSWAFSVEHDNKGLLQHWDKEARATLGIPQPATV